MGKKVLYTPRGIIRNGLRLIWMRSRERAAALKAAGHACEECGAKASKAKGREQKVEVHHRDGINWDGLVELFRRRVLPPPDRLIVLCPKCHEDVHRDNN